MTHKRKVTWTMFLGAGLLIASTVYQAIFEETGLLAKNWSWELCVAGAGALLWSLCCAADWVADLKKELNKSNNNVKD